MAGYYGPVQTPNTDFSADFLRGAQVGNMAAQQQERMMQLRAQAALNAVHERMLSAQADMLAQHASLYQQQALQEKRDLEEDANLVKANQAEHAQNIAAGMTPEQSWQQQIIKTSMVKPALGEKMAKGFSEYTRARENTDFAPQIVPVRNPVTGENMPVLRTGPKTSQMVEGKEKADEVGQAFKLYQAAQASGNEELATYHKAHLAKLTQATGMTIKTNPDGSVEIVQGPVGGPDTLTKANQSKVQEAQAQSLATIDVANRLEPLISDETVGAKAFAKSWINDRILAQRFPELANSTRANAEQLASQLRASAVKELRSDSNITEGERKQIMQAIPQINDPVDSPARARRLIQDIRKMAAVRAMVASKRLGGAVPKQAASVLEDTDLADLFKQGLITQAQAKEAYQLKRQE